MTAPGLHGSGHTDVTPSHAAEVADSTPLPGSDRGTGPVPPENRPGRRPRRDQDKPSPSRRPRGAGRPSPADGPLRFAFRFDPLLQPLSRLFGVRPESAYALVDEEALTIRFGRWTLRTPIDNVASAVVTGPYDWWKIAGPPHLSLRDRGITFATSSGKGVCVSFREPVPAALPVPVLRHPAATVTPEDLEGFLAALSAAGAGHS